MKFSSSNLKYIFLLFLYMQLISCKVRIKEPIYYFGTFKFKQKNDEIFLKPSLISFLKVKPFCSVVLRVPSKQNSIVEEERYNNRSIYFAMEKILLENNFKVTDRSFFEKKFTDGDTSLKFSPDLILELVDFRPINYYTDKVIPDDNKDEKEMHLPKYFYFTGARTEFKITQVYSGEVVATFILNYTPCIKGCRLKYTLNGDSQEQIGDFKIRKNNGYDSIDTDENYEMFVELSQRLVDELRKWRETKN